jgi:hypothetical protein
MVARMKTFLTISIALAVLPVTPVIAGRAESAVAGRSGAFRASGPDRGAKARVVAGVVAIVRRGRRAFRGAACLSEAKDVSRVESETTRGMR